MKKILITLFLLPAILLAKYQITTYFPLESYLVKSIAQNDTRTKEVTNRYLDEYRELPYSEVLRLSGSKAYFHFGLTIEKEYEKVLLKENPTLKIVDISRNIPKINNNPYVWMDPFLLREVVKNITESLCEIDGSSCDKYNQNAQEFYTKIDNVFLEIKDDFYKSNVLDVFVFNDYFLYFTKRFRINSYKRETDFIKSTDITPLVHFVEENNIKKLLYSKDIPFNLASSYKSNIGLNIVENDIFEENILLNLKKLSASLFK